MAAITRMPVGTVRAAAATEMAKTVAAASVDKDTAQVEVKFKLGSDLAIGKRPGVGKLLTLYVQAAQIAAAAAAGATMDRCSCQEYGGWHHATFK
jgi:hypothetical protein